MSCFSGSAFAFEFYKFMFNKTNNEISLIGVVRDRYKNRILQNVKIYLGKVIDNKLIIKKEIPIGKYGNFDFATNINSEDRLFFYTFDEKNDEIIMSPLEIFYLYKLYEDF